MIEAMTEPELIRLTAQLAALYPEAALSGLRSGTKRTPREMILAVAAAYEVDPEDLTRPGNVHGSALKQARSALAVLLRDKRFFGYTLQDIGRLLGRDHSTVRVMLDGIRYDYRFLEAETEVLKTWRHNVTQ